MLKLILAQDKSLRTVDADGRLHVAKSHISKSNISPYLGSEIPDYENFGLDPERVYRLYRDANELERAAPTFARLPILSEHVPISADAPRNDLVVGAIGSDIEFVSPYLDADLCFWDAKAIAAIESEKVRELSCAYRYVPVMEPGTINGEVYDGRMTQIQGNHLALVPLGRAGSDVVVADALPNLLKDITMTKAVKALIAALCAVSPKLAADAALPAAVATATRKNKPEIKTKILAMDASIDSNKLDAVLDAVMDTEAEESPRPTEPKDPMPKAAGDAGPEDKVRRLLDGKVDPSIIDEVCQLMGGSDGEDAMSNVDDPEPQQPGMEKANDEPPKEMMKKAMDGLRAQLRDAEIARREVRDVVGDVTVAMDTAAEVYGFALDQMKIDRKDIKEQTALRALFKVAASNRSQSPVPRIAQDADAAIKQFPQLARFRNA